MATNPERTSSGLLQINVINIQNNFPIQNARVTISYKGEPDRTVEQLTTNSSGQTEQVQLPAPPVEYSLEPSIIQPYSEYNLMVEAEGFEPLAISGTEILAQATAIQPAVMTPVGGETPPESYPVRELPPKDSGTRDKTSERERGNRTQPGGSASDRGGP